MELFAYLEDMRTTMLPEVTADMFLVFIRFYDPFLSALKYVVSFDVIRATTYVRVLGTLRLRGSTETKTFPLSARRFEAGLVWQATAI